MKKNQSAQKVEKLFIESATKLQQGDAAGARRGLEKVSKLASNSAAVWYNLALSGQHLGMHHKAVKEYKKSLKLNPSQIDAMINLGLSYKALEQKEEALEIAQKALNLKPDHSRALNFLGTLFAETGEYEQAVPLLERALENDVQNEDARLNLANSFLESGDSHKAEKTIAPLIEETVSAKQAVELYVQIILDQKRYPEVPPILKKLKERYKDDQDVKILEMSFCELINDNFSVVDIAEKLLVDSPKNARIWSSLGNAYFQLDSIANAKESYTKAMQFDPEHPEYSNNLGLTYASLGEKEKAEHYYRNALVLNSDYVEAYRNLVAMKKFQSLDDPDCLKLQELWENDKIPEQTRSKLAFALGKIYDDCGVYDQAFESYDEGNRLKSKEVDMDFKQYFSHIDRTIDVLNRHPSNPVRSNQNHGQPIFILGMSRSGTTLVEQIVSRHPNVTGCGELPCIERAIGNLEKGAGTRRIYPDDFNDLSEVEFAAETASYGDWVSRLHDIKTDFFTDKMPFNFVHVWLIKALFPDASVIHCHRHPLDVIVSNYFQLFGSDINFVYDLEVLTGYYLCYHKLMKHWHKLFGDGVYKVQYEALVADADNQTKLLIAGAGLEWDDSCLDPNRSDTAVRTASIWQVREGIYTSSKERWRRYEKHLGGVIDTLQINGVLDKDCNYVD